MRPDFRREYQIDWVHAEAERLRESFGEAIEVETHVLGGVFTCGERVMTISDPGGRGIGGAICLTDRSEEGSLWTAELFPIPEDGMEHVPPTRSIQTVTLQMRYNRCVHATHNRVIGKTSGADGAPDFMQGVTRLLTGSVFLQRRHSLSRGQRVEAYAKASA
ncbi:MAG: hypothetical protein JW722_08735 [Demequinaceae bacterium]|nr:hypothetical protein [Demequinaceae bacterium]